MQETQVLGFYRKRLLQSKPPCVWTGCSTGSIGVDPVMSRQNVRSVCHAAELSVERSAHTQGVTLSRLR